MEKYFAFKYNLIIVGLTAFAIVCVVYLCVLIYEIWKDRRRKK